MTKEEIIKSIKNLKAYYPYYYSNITKDEAKEIVEVWEDNFSKIPFDLMKSAIKEWSIRNTKPPTIADLRTIISKNYMLVKDENLKNILWDFLTNK